MSSRTAALALEITSDADRAAAQVDDLAGSYRELAKAEETAARAADSVESAHRSVADGADNLATKSSTATGALGALSAGFELVGAEKYAGSLQSAAMATDFMSGVGDSLTLVMEMQSLQTARAKVAMIGHKAATVASTVATKAQAVAQRALNLVMRANPIGLIIAAVMVLVGVFATLYARNEGFRTAVQAVGRAGAAAFGWVVDKAKVLVGWVRDKLGPAFALWKKGVTVYVKAVITVISSLVSGIKTAVTWVKDRLVGGFQVMKALAGPALRAVTTAVEKVTGATKTAVTWAKEKLGAAFTTAKSAASTALEAITSPVNALKDAVKAVVDWIGKIKFPSPPGWMKDLSGKAKGLIPGGYTGETPTATTETTTTDSHIIAPSLVMNVTVNGALDPIAVGRQIEQLGRRAGLSVGVAP